MHRLNKSDGCLKQWVIWTRKLPCCAACRSRVEREVPGFSKATGSGNGATAANRRTISGFQTSHIRILDRAREGQRERLVWSREISRDVDIE